MDIGGVVHIEEGCLRQEQDIDRMKIWAEHWQEFIPKSPMWCILEGKIMIKGIQYKRQGLGVYHISLELLAQMDPVIKKACGMLDFINIGSQNLWVGSFGTTLENTGWATAGAMCSLLITL